MVESASDDYLWIVLFSGVVCLAMAWGIGAIDVATSVASGIGAKAFTMKQAVFIILIFEFSGAALLGGAVTETVRTKITNYNVFDGKEDVLMLGMMTSLIAATGWLFVAAQWEMPISSAHSIIGGIVGFVLVSEGFHAIEWALLAYIIAFWIISPALTACISIAFFVPMRKYLLRREDSWEHTLRTWPIFVSIVVWIGAIFLFLEISPMEHAIWQSTLTSAGVGFMFYLGAIKTGLLENYCEKKVAQDKKEAEEREAMAAARAVSETELTDKSAASESESASASASASDVKIIDEHAQMMDDANGNIISPLNPQPRQKTGSFFGKIGSISSLEVDVHAQEEMDDLEAAIHKSCEKFDPRVEKAFSILQLASASLDNFAHGSNDVANAVAPFATIYSLYVDGKFRADVPVPFWMIAILIAGMIVGLATFGYHVIRALGVKMTCLTNTRGYGTELSSAVLVIFASYFGFPASSAHVQVGAIVGTGIAEKVGNPQCPLKWNQLINWGLLCEMFAGWILTIVVCGVASGGLFSMMAYSPYMGSTCH